MPCRSMALAFLGGSFFRSTERKEPTNSEIRDLLTHLTQGWRMWGVWRAASPPKTLPFPVRRRHSLRRTGKGGFWGGCASPNPSTA